MGINKHLSNASAYAAALEGLMDGASTVHELSEESGLALSTLRKWVAALKRRKLVFVSAWEKDPLGRHTRPVFALGRDKRDVPRPPRQTMEQRRKTYYAKRRVLAATRGTTMKQTRVNTLPASAAREIGIESRQ